MLFSQPNQEELSVADATAEIPRDYRENQALAQSWSFFGRQKPVERAISALTRPPDYDDKGIECFKRVHLQGEKPLLKKFLFEFSSPDDGFAEEFSRIWENHNTHQIGLRLVSGEETRRLSFLVVTNNEHEYKIQNGHGVLWPNVVPPLQPLPVGNMAVIPKLIGRIRHLAQFSVIKMLEHPYGTSALLNKFSLEVLSTQEPPSLERNTLQESEGAFDVDDGKVLSILIKNYAPIPVYFVLLNLRQLYGISQLYPLGSDFMYLDPGEEYKIKVRMAIPQQLRHSTAKGVLGLDILKAFITSQPTSFRCLELPTIDRGEATNFHYVTKHQSELQNLLGKLDCPQREANCGDAINYWQTMDIRIRTWSSVTSE